MKMGNVKRNGVFRKITKRAVGWWAIVAMALCSVAVVRGVLLANAQKMGNELAHSYSVENTKSIVAYKAMLRLSA